MGNKKDIPLFDLKISPEARRLVALVLKSGWLTTGPMTRTLETRLASLLKVPQVAAVSSATAGLVASLRAVGVREGTEVITTPFTFVASIESIIANGAKPVFCDIDRETLAIDAQQIERKITKRTVAIVPVDIGGHPADYDLISSIAKRKKLSVISDSAHALLSRYNGKAIPHFTTASVFSLHATKNLTSGEGGAVAARDHDLLERIRVLSRHAMTKNAWQRRQTKTPLYDVVGLGIKGNLSDLHAAVALGQLSVLASEQKKRERIVAQYLKNLADSSDLLVVPTVRQDSVSGWHLFIIQLRAHALKIDREACIEKMRELGIECGVHYQPIPVLTYYRKLGYTIKEFPVLQSVAPTVVSLPLFPHLTMAEVDRICDALCDLLRKYKR